MRRTTAGMIALAVAIVLGAAACGSSAQSTDSSAGPTSSVTPAPSDMAGGAAITIKTFMFKPNPLQVKAGTTVTWTNTDQILHTVTSGTRAAPDGIFDMKLDGVGATATFTFATAGTFAYHCSIHPGMDATVEVT